MARAAPPKIIQATRFRSPDSTCFSDFEEIKKVGSFVPFRMMFRSRSSRGDGFSVQVPSPSSASPFCWGKWACSEAPPTDVEDAFGKMPRSRTYRKQPPLIAVSLE